MKLHGGDIDIRSRLGEGTRVTVRLPIDCEGGKRAAESDQARDRAAPVKLPPSPNVLVKKSA